MSDNDRMAPEGATFVCGACGKESKDLYGFSDESCMLNAVLCSLESVKKNASGRVIAAEAYKP